MLAWMSMHMPMNKLGLSSDKRREAQRIRVADKNDPYFRSISTSRLATPRARDDMQEPSDVVLGVPKSPNKCIALADCDELLSTGLCFHDEGDAARFSPSWFAILKPMDVERWKCAAALFKENPPSGIRAEYDGLLSTSTSDWPPLTQQGVRLGVSIWILFVCATLVYGGLHALPWNSVFRTRHEQVLWRTSVGIIIGLGPLTMAVYLATVLFVRMAERRPLTESFRLGEIRKWREQSLPFKNLINSGSRLGFWVGYFIVGAIFLAYGLARTYIVVECFIALFNSEPGIFEAPSWSAYFPHIS